MKNSRQRTIVIVLAVVSIILVSTGVLIRMSILPSEEGLNTGIYGFGESLYGEVYSAKNPPVTPTPGEEGYELLNDDPHNYAFGYWNDFTVLVTNYNERSDMRIEVSQPWHENYREIEYWIDLDDEMVLVKGDVWIYHVDIGFSMISKEEPGIHVFQGTPVWFTLVTTVWDNVIQDPITGKTGQAWGAPISVYVESWNVDETGMGEHYDIEPSLEGRFITMYSEPDSSGATIDDLGISSGGNVNSTLSDERSPDSRMQRTAFTRFVLSDFGITTHYGWLGGISGRDYPSVRYKLKVYFLSLGKWTFTKDEAEDWEEREGKQERRNLFTWWEQLNPWQKIGLGVLGSTIFIALILIVLAYTGVLSTILAFKFSKRSA